jgi:hypothetical protein
MVPWRYTYVPYHGGIHERLPIVNPIPVGNGRPGSAGVAGGPRVRSCRPSSVAYLCVLPHARRQVVSSASWTYASILYPHQNVVVLLARQPGPSDVRTFRVGRFVVERKDAGVGRERPARQRRTKVGR